MLVKMLVEVSGLRDGKPWPSKGGTVELPDDEAVVLFENRMAAPVHDPESGVERAVVDDSHEERRAALVPHAADLEPEPETVPVKRPRGRPRKAS